MKKLLIIDDQPIVRAAATLFIANSNQFTVCGETGDALIAQKMVSELKPDIILADILLGGRDGVELLKILKAIDPEVRILIFSSFDESVYAQRCIQAGALGYLMKSSPTPLLCEALKQVAAGHYFVSENMERNLP